MYRVFASNLQARYFFVYHPRLKKQMEGLAVRGRHFKNNEAPECSKPNTAATIAPRSWQDKLKATPLVLVGNYSFTNFFTSAPLILTKYIPAGSVEKEKWGISHLRH